MMAPDIRCSGGRRTTACRRCHKQKVKCSRDKPCRNCQAANIDCVYPERERVLSVPESYLRSLEADRDRRERPRYSSRLNSHAGPDDNTSSAANDGSANTPSHPTVENSAAELFVAKVKQLRQNATFSASSDPSPGDDVESSEALRSQVPPGQTSYEYFPLAYDTAQPQLSLHLPPFPYAKHLLDLVEIYMGHDYHWFLWRRFKERMDLTYKNPGSPESKDRLWLCQLLIVFALGETFVNYQAPAIHLGPSPHHDRGQEDGLAPTPPPPPGATFFEQALVLLKIPFEEPTLEYIEALNLATFYSYSLNRKKTAYMYAGMSARMSNMLRLHLPSPQSSFSASEQEHRKRVCWTSYCMDKMTSSELGLIPSFQPGQIKVEFPTSEPLTPDDVGQFHEAEFLRARIQITLMKAEADVFIDMWQSIRDDIPDVERRVKPILMKLQSWLAELPENMSFDFESGMPEAMARMPTVRSLASLYLRCHQCFILLLRPLFLKHITHILSDEMFSAPQDNLQTFSNRCLVAARANFCILIKLWCQELVAKFGFWDSLHLFSSLTILSLAMTANHLRPGSFEEKHTDTTTYSTARDLLRDMVQAGNLASKGYEKMLADVEALGEAPGAMQTDGFEPPMEQWDMDNWIDQVLSLDNTSMLFNALE